MGWCQHCASNVPTHSADGRICCTECGKVLEEDNFAEEPTFVKTANGQSTIAGNYVKSFDNQESASRERTISEALCGINSLIDGLLIEGGGSIANAALRLYTIALDRNFTRGRRRELVQGSCLYIACREGNKPYLLIDFSEHLKINVYELGAIFLKLCQLLSLEEHPIVQKPVDPSLFIHKFTFRLLGNSNSNVSNSEKHKVSRNALLIVASMKRDWMQTGRKPSGLCGAAIYISALSQGFTFLKSDITKVVHICEATLTKRLIEFENTESGSLTIDELTKKAKQLEKEEMYIQPLSKASGIGELLCEHKGRGVPHFAHGLCESCYKDFIELSGGIDGINRSEPPAFQRAEMERIRAKEAGALKVVNSDKQESIKNVDEYEDSQPRESDLTGAKMQQKMTNDSVNERVDQTDDTIDESDTLSDIDDTEVDVYLHNKEETERKKIVWEEMNKEYLEEQAAKEAAAEAARKAYEAQISNCSEEQKQALKLAAEAAAAVAMSKKEKKKKQAAELKNMGPPQSAVEATKQMLNKKRLSSKINYDVLDELFSESEEQETPETKKKTRIDPEPEDNKEDPEIETMEDNYIGDDLEEYNDDDSVLEHSYDLEI